MLAPPSRWPAAPMCDFFLVDGLKRRRRAASVGGRKIKWRRSGTSVQFWTVQVLGTEWKSSFIKRHKKITFQSRYFIWSYLGLLLLLLLESLCKFTSFFSSFFFFVCCFLETKAAKKKKRKKTGFSVVGVWRTSHRPESGTDEIIKSSSAKSRKKRGRLKKIKIKREQLICREEKRSGASCRSLPR